MNKNIDYGDLRETIGFFEGEGYIGINNHGQRGKYNNNYHLKMVFSNTNKAKLNWIQSKIKIGEVNASNRVTSKAKLGYELRLRTHEMKEFLETILPHLLIKKYQALIVLRWFKEITNNMHAKKGTSARDLRITFDELALRARLYEEIKLLNKKGILTNEELEEIKDIQHHYDVYYQENYFQYQKDKVLKLNGE